MDLQKTIKSLLLVLMAAIMSLSASAYDFDFMVDGLCYNINSNGTSVTVTYQGTGQQGYGYANLSGLITIPSTVAYDDVSYSVSSIGEFAFSNCTGLTSVTIPTSVTSIGQNAFWGCTGLTSVTIPTSVTSIGQNAFWSCTGLTSVNIPNSVAVIGQSAFSGCYSLTSVDIPNSVTTISRGLFYDCISLTSVNIPESVTEIGNSAFSNCFGLTSLSISNLVTSIGNYAFAGCRGLKSIVVESGNPNYDSRDNCNALIETATNTLLAGCKNTIIPTSVTSIGSSAFSGCRGLTSVDIPNSVTTIGQSAFWGCTGLTSVNIPSSVTSIGEQAFENCTNLTSVSISDLAAWCNIDFLGYDSKSNPLSFAHSLYLNGSLITELSIPSTVSTLKGYTFSGGNFTSLVVPNSVTTIYSTAFYNCTNMTTVTIDNNSIVSKDNHNNSTDYPIKNMFGSQVQHYIFGDNVKSIGNYAFQQCTSLVSVTTGNSVKSIGECAFKGCSALTSVNFGNKVTNIKQGSFWDCIALTSLDFPSSLNGIGSCAFMGCVGLTTVYIPSSVTSISFENPFFGCSGLESIVVESGNPNFDSRDNCNAIIKISNNELVAGCKNTVIPQSVSCIGRYAFYGCKGLTAVVIPYSVTQILDRAFMECEFTSVTLHNNLYTNSYYPVTQYFESNNWDTLTIVGNGIWNDHNLYNMNQRKTLNIGSGITDIDIGVSSEGKFALDVFNCYAETPPGLGQRTQYCFSNFNGELHVPVGSAEAYSSAEFWKNFSNIIPDLTDKVKLDKTSTSLAQGRTLKLNVTEMPDGGEVIWGTSNPSVATVDDDGTVTATGEGGCYIFASLASNPAVYASCYININQAETFYAYNGYLKFQVIDDEQHEAALSGYKEAINVNGDFWGIQFPADEPVVVPSVVTHNGVEYTVTEIGDNALYLLGWFENKQRYTDFWPQIILPETIRRLGKRSLWTNGEYGYTRVNLPHSLEEMADSCLLTCTYGGQYTMLENVNSIGKNVFQGPGVGVLTFMNHDFELNANMFNLSYIQVLTLWGENLSIAAGTFNGTSYNTTTEIERLVFGLYPCSIASNAFGENTAINKIVVYCPEPYSIPDNAFTTSIYQNAKLLVPENALENYRNAPGWKNFASIESICSGDVNYDGVITASDITAQYDYMLNFDMKNFTGADVNGDGNITAADITAIYDILLGNK